MKKWINNLSFALRMTAALATGTAFAQTSSTAAASAASAATAASLPNRLDPQRDAAQDIAAATAMAQAQAQAQGQGQHVPLNADGKWLLLQQGTDAREAGNGHDKLQVLAFLTPYANGTGQ